MQKGLNYLDEKRVELIYEMPLAEVLFEFYDRLNIDKPRIRVLRLRDDRLQADRSCRSLRVLINGDKVDALSQLVFRDNAAARARLACNKLKDEIPRHQFKIALQGVDRRQYHSQGDNFRAA